jgi:isoquinoline 1-oxidoreductase beta subunit
VIKRINRRVFLKLTAASASGIIFGFSPLSRGTAAKPADTFKPISLFQIDPLGKVTIWCMQTEMGQGVKTLMATVTAEEMDLDLSEISVQTPPPGKLYSGMSTGGSSSAAAIFSLRSDLANVRQLFINAAAHQLKVKTSLLTTAGGSVINKQNGRSIPYAELIETARSLSLPQATPTKSISSFKIIGKPIRNIESEIIVTGKTCYGIDVKLPDMVYASIVRCPVVGGKLQTYDDSDTRKIAGFISCLTIKGNDITSYPDYVRDGVAVVAENTWAAMKAAEAVVVRWDLGKNEHFETGSYMQQLRTMSNVGGTVFREEKTNIKAIDAIKLEEHYEGPFLSHSPMEPMNCTAHIHNNKCEVWVPCHDQSRLLDGVKSITKFNEEDITIHTTMIGGSFGRRLQVDYALEAVLLAQQLRQPVQIVWTRVQDTKFGVYRSPYVHYVRGDVKDGAIVNFEHNIACSSVWKLREPSMIVDGLDYTVLMPAKILPYEIPNVTMKQSIAALDVPIGWWRASYPSINHTVQECWIDELAFAAKKDPLELRLEMLAKGNKKSFAWQEGWGEDVIDRKRLANTLEVAGQKSDWHKKRKKGHGKGIACSIYAGGKTYVAQVIDLEIKNQTVKVHKVTCVVDCGMVLNPDTVRAQMEGGIIFGLSGALYGEITFKNGQVEQNSFADYRILRFSDTPEIDIIIIESTEAVGGVGEPGSHPTAAASCNAIFNACGIRIRTLPIIKALQNT